MELPRIPKRVKEIVAYGATVATLGCTAWSVDTAARHSQKADYYLEQLVDQARETEQTAEDTASTDELDNSQQDEREQAFESGFVAATLALASTVTGCYAGYLTFKRRRRASILLNDHQNKDGLPIETKVTDEMIRTELLSEQ